MTNYTLAELQAMPNDDLNALAAELRGLQYLPRSGNVFDFVWMDGDKVYAQEIAFTADRNQSGELLQWAAARFDGAITKEPIMFDVTFGRFERNKRLPGIDAYQHKFVERGYDKRMEWSGSAKWIVQIPGNDARAETIAFCAAMLAMKGRLK